MSLFGKLIGNAPSGSLASSALTRTTVTVDATVATKQDLLPAVGAGMQQIVPDVVVRNPSQSLAAITGGQDVVVGYNAFADNVALLAVNNLVDDSLMIRVSVAGPAAVGVSGDILGCIIDPVLYPPMIVAGAGTGAANGTYLYQGLFNSKPQYDLASPLRNIQWDGIDRWKIYDDDNGLLYYYSLDDVATPDLCTTWVADVAGSNPVPTVTAGANPTFDVDVFWYEVSV